MDIRELTIKINSEADLKGFDKADKETSSLSGKITGLNAAFELAYKGAMLLKSGLEVALGRTIEYASNIDDTSKRLGVSRQSLQELGYAAKQAGVDSEALFMGMAKVEKGFTEALKTGAGPFKDTLDLLGIKFKDIQKLKPDKVFELIGTELSKISDEKIRTGLAMEVFGKSGAVLLPIFEEGAEGIKKMRKEAHELGGVLSDEAIIGAADFDDQLNRVKLGLNGVALSIGSTLIPHLEKYVEIAIEWWKNNREVIQQKVDEYVEKVANHLEKFGLVLTEVIGPFVELIMYGTELIQSGLVEFLDYLGISLDDVVGFVKDFVAVIREVSGPFKDFVVAVKDFGFYLYNEYSDAFHSVTTAANDFFKALFQLSPEGEKLWGIFEKVKALFSGLGDTLKSVTIDVDAVTGGLKKATEYLNKVTGKDVKPNENGEFYTEGDPRSTQPGETYGDAEALMLLEEKFSKASEFFKGVGNAFVSKAEQEAESQGVRKLTDASLAYFAMNGSSKTLRSKAKEEMKRRAREQAKKDRALQNRFANMRNKGKDKEKEENVDAEIMALLEKSVYGNSEKAKSQLRGKNVPKIDPSVAVQIANTNVYQTIDARVMVQSQPGEATDTLATKIVSHRGDVFERKIRDALEYFTPVFVR